MFSLNLREGVLVLAILTAMLLGVAVKHWRDTQREQPVPVPVTTTKTVP